jgi:MraZ protein
MAAVEEANAASKLLTGTDDTTLDNKGRLLLSKKKRDRLGEKFAMAIGELGCICIYPQESWAQQAKDMEAIDPMNPGRRQFQRLFYGNSEDDLACDTQGRVVIPGNLRSKVALKEKILVVGCFDHIEIWDPAEYELYEADPDEYKKDKNERYVTAYYTMKGLASPFAKAN